MRLWNKVFEGKKGRNYLLIPEHGIYGGKSMVIKMF